MTLPPLSAPSFPHFPSRTFPSPPQLSAVTIVHIFEAQANTKAPRSMYLQYTIIGPGHGTLPIYNVISCIAFPVPPFYAETGAASARQTHSQRANLHCGGNAFTII